MARAASVSTSCCVPRGSPPREYFRTFPSDLLARDPAILRRSRLVSRVALSSSAIDARDPSQTLLQETKMNLFTEYGLLIAVATPVTVVVALQVYLFVAGERGTLLLPSLRPYESIALEPASNALPETEAPRTVFAEVESSPERLAA